MPKVSIIVPIYKVDNYLAQCLNSIERQTLKDIEILLIDEGDQDRCRDIIDDYAANDDRIVALHDKHGGYGNSVNAGIEAATGEYIGFVESDDFIDSKMFELLYEAAIKTGADVVKCPFYNYSDDTGNELPRFLKQISERLPTGRSFSPKVYPDMFASHPSIWAGIYKTEWLKNSGIRFLPKGAYLDIKFRFEVLMSTEKIAWVTKPMYHWRITNPTSTNATWNYKAAVERWKYIHDYFQDKPELWDRIAPIIVAEEYNNIFSKVSYKSDPEKRMPIAKQFREYYTEEHITQSVYLNNDEKHLMLGFGRFFTSYNIKRILNYTADVLDRKRKKVLICVTAMSSVILLMSLKNGLFDVVLDNSVNDVLINIMTIIAIIAIIAFIIYWGVLVMIRIMQDLVNIKRINI